MECYCQRRLYGAMLYLNILSAYINEKRDDNRIETTEVEGCQERYSRGTIVITAAVYRTNGFNQARNPLRQSLALGFRFAVRSSR